jgi:glycosyltransferase involved in cell wall biosynthesis
MARHSFGIGETAIVVGVLARLHPSKGQALVLEGVIRLVAEGHDVHFVIIGGPARGDYFDGIVRRARESGCQDRIHAVGPIGDVERYYPMLDFSINSRIDPEPFGISIVESMMSERPVLVHALGGPAETVVDGVTGWHYHDATVDGVSAALKRAIADRSRWPAMRVAARAHAIEHFSVNVQASRYMTIVESVLSRDR